MEKHLKSFFIYFLFLLVAVFSLPAHTVNSEFKKVRVGYVNVAGYEEGLEGEHKSGFGYEYLQKISYYTNWKYEYVYGSFSQLIEMLAKGEIDLLGDVSYTPEREKKINYSSYPQGSEKYYLFARKEREEFTYGDLSVFNNQTIGLAKNTYQAQLARDWAVKYNMNVNFIEYENSPALIKALDAQSVDLIVLTDATEGANYHPVCLVGFKEYYFAVSKERTDLLLDLNDALAVIQGINPNYNALVESKYMDVTVGTTFLAKTEKEWLAGHNNKITIGYLDNNLPFSSSKGTENVYGYLEVLVNTMKQRFDIDVVTKPYNSMYDLFNAMKAGEIDAFGPAIGDFYLSEKYDHMQTDAIFETQLFIVYNGKETKINTIAVSNEHVLFDDYVNTVYPESNILLCKNTNECLDAVVNGTADCMLVGAQSIYRLKEYKNWNSINYMQSRKNADICVFVPRGESELLNIFNKSISLSKKDLQGADYLSNIYLDTNQSFWDLIREHGKEFIIFSGSVIAILLILLYKTAAAKKDLNKALLQANAANEAKTIFLNNMSHDIRTPMNAILGFTRFLEKEEKLSVQGRNYLGKIEDSGEYLLTIINNVLDMARIESGKISLDVGLVNLADEKDSAPDIFQSELKKKNLMFTKSINVTHPYVMTDSAKLKQILINLLSNAVKYTPEGGQIWLDEKELPSDKPGYGIYVTTVTDTGIGMSETFIEHIFDAFTREKTTTESNVIGTGLGMSIVKRLVDLLGGKIDIKSELGKGSTFVITLELQYVDNPKEMCSKKEEKSVVDFNFKGNRVLLAEDNDLNAEIATVILEELGISVERAADGVECVDMLLREDAGYYQFILMDIQMPNLSGYGATAKIRRFADERKAKIPIIAMTANAFEEDKRAAIKAGMNGHIAKPINVELMMKLLAEQLNVNQELHS